MEISKEDLDAFSSELHVASQRSHYISSKIYFVNEAIGRITSNDESFQNVIVEEDKEHGFGNLITIMRVFYDKMPISSLNGYCLMFIIEFLDNISEKQFQDVSIENVQKEVTEEQMKILVGVDYYRNKNIQKLQQKGFGNVLEGFGIK